MGIRTVRLDDDSEKVLTEIVGATGLSVSAALKKGLLALRNQVAHAAPRAPFDVYRELDLGPGGSAIAPATEVKAGVRAALRRKLRR